MFSKKNRLISTIIISMILGSIIGYGINKSLTDNSPKIEQSYLKQLSKGNSEVEKKLDKIKTNIEKDKLKQVKKK